MTREIRKPAEVLGVSIHDHLVIGRKGHASFRSLGLLSLWSLNRLSSVRPMLC
jgi:DNA repair protein RadC